MTWVGPSFCACGSMVSASPAAAQRTVCAEAGVAATPASGREGERQGEGESGLGH